VYLACGAAAYTIVYVLSPGYIYSGYLSRHAPFTVFLTDVIVAVGLYVAFKTAVHCMRSTSIPDAGTGWRAALVAYAQGSLTATSVGLALFLAAFWIVVQASYVQWLPPTHYAFLKTLAQPPYRGATFVVDNYAAPVAAYTGQWAYFDPEVALARFVRDKGMLRLASDRQYLWFADRETNADYGRPKYFLCMIPQTPYSALVRILQKKRQEPSYLGCSMRPLVRLAKSGVFRSELQLIKFDQAGLHEIGFDAWAIVRFLHDGGESGVVLDPGLKRLVRANQP
jgi:hypothetical protein